MPDLEPPRSDAMHLDEEEQSQRARYAAPRAVVIHEVVRKEGEADLKRSPVALAWSGLAAGLSMGFSFLTLAMIQAGLPATPWRRLIDSFGYSLGFIIVILGRQQLFTESTLTVVLPVLTHRDWPTFAKMLRFWGVVLASNLLGSIMFAALISPPGTFPPAVERALYDTARQAVDGPFGPTLLKAVLAGWLIALMVWLLPSARSARLFVILLFTYAVALGRFSHIIAGSVDAAFAVITGGASIGAYITGFLIPTLIGNTIGGVSLVALLNHVPLAQDWQE